jgi:hypothetical protein
MSIESRAEIILELAEQIENFRFCSPSDDPDEPDAVVYSFKHLVKRFIGHARKIQNQDFQNSIGQINTDIENNIYEAYDLHSDLQVIIDDIRELLSKPSVEWSALQTEFIDSSVIEKLSQIQNKKYDLAKVIQFCREINGTFNSGYFFATALLIRALINHIPPIFGYERFEQVVSQSTKSRKELFKPLDDIARDVADLHTHDTIRHKENLPTKRQLEPFKPNVEILLQEIITELQKTESSEPKTG